jgi:hypothetical protein
MSEPPRILPVFPLTGVVLLPLSWLPLHVFEPRYRAMVEDAAAGDGFIGMIQPLVAQDDNSPDSSPEGDAPAGDPPRLYPVGCAGRIERCERQADGRFLILLRGVSRFRVRGELAPRRGYRRVEADYREFAGDLREAEAEVDPAPALEAALALGRARGFELDLEKIAGLPGFSLVNGLTAAMPLSPAEKQALIEAADPLARQELLTSLLEMNAGAAAGPSGSVSLPSPLVN